MYVYRNTSPLYAPYTYHCMSKKFKGKLSEDHQLYRLGTEAGPGYFLLQLEHMVPDVEQ